jgi:6-phosphogluconolactonase (cycloisomerase 2 family)
MLKECGKLDVKPGDGPRHGVFWSPPPSSSPKTHGNNKTLLYIVNELANTVTSYAVSYTTTPSCLSFEAESAVQQVISPYPPGNNIPDTANVGEIRLWGQNLYVSVRNDQGFPDLASDSGSGSGSGSGSDSMVTLSIAPDSGELSFSDITPSYGKTPRTFVINNAGDLVAIGNQVSSSVAIVRRDVQTGRLGRLVASIQVGSPGKVGSSTGLSSVVWDE